MSDVLTDKSNQTTGYLILSVQVSSFLKKKNTCTVKQGFSKHTYNELMLTAKLFSFPITLLHVVYLTNVTITFIAKQKRLPQALRYKHVLLYVLLHAKNLSCSIFFAPIALRSVMHCKLVFNNNIHL